MKMPSKIAWFAIFASIAFALSTIIFSSCAEDPSIVDITDNPSFDGLATDKVTHTHRKGTDPCPQNFNVNAEVYCSLEAAAADCLADSVSIENVSPGLEATFNGGWTTSKLDPDPAVATLINFKFTCAIAQSFTHTYKLVFFLNGNKVREEDLSVDITVI